MIVALMLTTMLTAVPAPRALTPAQQQELSADVTSVQAKIRALEREIRTLERDRTLLRKQSVEHAAALLEQKEALERLEKRHESELARLAENVSGVREESSREAGRLDSELGRLARSWGVAIPALALLSFGGFVLLRRRMERSSGALEEKLESHRKAIDEESVKVDERLVALLESRIAEERTRQEASPAPVKETEVDHSFAIRLGEEIHRMRTRIRNMPAETKGLKALSKSLERLGEDFNAQGYEIHDLLNANYSEGMNVEASFISDELLAQNAKTISKVVSPQINFNGAMIQMAKVEVSCGPES